MEYGKCVDVFFKLKIKGISLFFVMFYLSITSLDVIADYSEDVWKARFAKSDSHAVYQQRLKMNELEYRYCVFQKIDEQTESGNIKESSIFDDCFGSKYDYRDVVDGSVDRFTEKNAAWASLISKVRYDFNEIQSQALNKIKQILVPTAYKNANDRESLSYIRQSISIAYKNKPEVIKISDEIYYEKIHDIDYKEKSHQVFEFKGLYINCMKEGFLQPISLLDDIDHHVSVRDGLCLNKLKDLGYEEALSSVSEIDKEMALEISASSLFQLLQKDKELNYLYEDSRNRFETSLAEHAKKIKEDSSITSKLKILVADIWGSIKSLFVSLLIFFAALAFIIIAIFNNKSNDQGFEERKPTNLVKSTPKVKITRCRLCAKEFVSQGGQCLTSPTGRHYIEIVER